MTHDADDHRTPLEIWTLLIGLAGGISVVIRMIIQVGNIDHFFLPVAERS
jgi:hypothetical protein